MKHTMRDKLLVGAATALVTVGLMGGLAPVAYATPSEAALEEARAELESLGTELASIEDELEQCEADLTDTQQKLDDTQAQIDDTQSQISDTQMQLDEAREVLGANMRSSYKIGPVEFIEVILNSTSIDDFIDRIYYLDKVTQSQADAIEAIDTLEAQLKDQEAQLEDQQAELEATEAEQQEELDSTQDKVDEYQARVAEAQDYFNQLDEQVQEELRAEAEAEAAAAAAAAAADEEVEEQSATTTAVQAVTAPTTTTTQTTETTTDDDSKAETTTTETTTDASSSSTSSSSSSSTSTSKTVAQGGGLSSAYEAIGCSYVYGAAGPSTFDCSGLVCYCYGYGRGRTTYAMIASLKASGDWKTSLSELSTGDLVFTSTGHVGIYIGGGQMIHAPSPGRTVCIASVYSFIGGGTY